jgi:hypothetical protein
MRIVMTRNHSLTRRASSRFEIRWAGSTRLTLRECSFAVCEVNEKTGHGWSQVRPSPGRTLTDSGDNQHFDIEAGGSIAYRHGKSLSS